MRRVTFGGDDLTTFVWSGPAAHVKIIFPDPQTGGDIVALPDPEGPRPTTTRTYTPRRFDAATRLLDVDFVLHGHGPASIWAARARVGHQLVLMGPAPAYAVDAAAPWYVLVTDASALPATETILDALPRATPVTVIAEVAALDEARVLAGRDDLAVRWVVAQAQPGDAALAALTAYRWEAGAGRVYIGGESQAIRRVRAAVLDASGLAPAQIVARGYWRVGAVNHPDRDYAEN